ncbi:MAG: formyltransferase family protein [Pseudomonadota bacterium]
MPVMNSHRALVIIERSTLSCAFVDAWLKGGNTIAAFWTTDTDLLKSPPQDRLAARASDIPTLAELARGHRIPVVQTNKLGRRSETHMFPDVPKADTLITLMTHQIVPDWLLRKFGKRAINVHPAYLPHYKGPRPTLSLLIDGAAEKYGGVTVHVLDSGIDTGAIIAQRHVPYSPKQDYHSWTYETAIAGSNIASNELQKYLGGTLEAINQTKGTGNYRISDQFEFVIDSKKTINEVRKLFTLPKDIALHALIDNGLDKRRSIAIYRYIKFVSPPTGDAYKLTPISLEMDICDARIKLWRRRKLLFNSVRKAYSIARYRIVASRARTD